MLGSGSRFAIFAGLAVFTALFPTYALVGQAASPDAPTAGRLSEEEIDRQWRESVQKYDAQRTALVHAVDDGAQKGPFRPDWESLAQYKQPVWYQDAKFGIFIHWGLYSVPAYASEWYSRNMYQQNMKDYAHHVATYGTQDKFGYKDFIPMFKAEHFDPAAWARLFKDAGARYVVPVAEHHDGFAMYNSDLTDWCAGKMGPKRDLIGDLASAVRAEGLHFGASSHRAEHDWFFDGGRTFTSDVNDPKYASFYGPAHRNVADNGPMDLAQDWTYVSGAYLDDWLARAAEIVEKYHPDLMYFDWWIGHPTFRNHVARFAAFYYNEGAKRGTATIIDYKEQDFRDGAGTLDIERGQLTDIRAQHWQTDTSLSNGSWGYLAQDTFKTPETIVHQLADIVSKNGNLLLNIGPRPDGTIPEKAQETLLEVGSWLKVNGEAIYGTRPWKLFGEGPTKITGGAFHESEQAYTPQDFRFTTHGRTLYAIELGWPQSGEVTITSLSPAYLGADKIRQVSLLGASEKIAWEQKEDGLHLRLPHEPSGKYAYSFRIEFD